MADTVPANQNDEVKALKPSRPLVLTALCLFSFVYSGILALLMITALFYSGTLTRIVEKYASREAFLVSPVLIFLFLALLFSGVFTGTLLIWRMKKTGYYVFGVSILAITIFQLLSPQINVVATLADVGLLILFGFFFRLLR
jgi:hypothetical protein